MHANTRLISCIPSPNTYTRTAVSFCVPHCKLLNHAKFSAPDLVYLGGKRRTSSCRYRCLLRLLRQRSALTLALNGRKVSSRTKNRRRESLASHHKPRSNRCVMYSDLFGARHREKRSYIVQACNWVVNVQCARSDAAHDAPPAEL